MKKILLILTGGSIFLGIMVWITCLVFNSMFNLDMNFRDKYAGNTYALEVSNKDSLQKFSDHLPFDVVDAKTGEKVYKKNSQPVHLYLHDIIHVDSVDSCNNIYFVDTYGELTAQKGRSLYLKNSFIDLSLNKLDKYVVTSQVNAEIWEEETSKVLQTGDSLYRFLAYIKPYYDKDLRGTMDTQELFLTFQEAKPIHIRPELLSVKSSNNIESAENTDATNKDKEVKRSDTGFFHKLGSTLSNIQISENTWIIIGVIAILIMITAFIATIKLSHKFADHPYSTSLMRWATFAFTVNTFDCCIVIDMITRTTLKAGFIASAIGFLVVAFIVFLLIAYSWNMFEGFSYASDGETEDTTNMAVRSLVIGGAIALGVSCIGLDNISFFIILLLLIWHLGLGVRIALLPFKHGSNISYGVAFCYLVVSASVAYMMISVFVMTFQSFVNFLLIFLFFKLLARTEESCHGCRTWDDNGYCHLHRRHTYKRCPRYEREELINF